MEWWLIFSLMIAGLLLLMLTGLPVGFSFILITIAVMYALMGGGSGLKLLVLSIYDSLTKFNLTPIPFFVIMGEVLFHSGLASRTLNVLAKWVGPLPGRLSIITLLSGGLFAALSGSAVANTAMLGSLMVPEMRRRGYSAELTVGPIMCSGALAMIIPPSALAVLLGTLAEISIGKLLIGAFLPGVLLLGLYLLYVMAKCLVNPSHAPKYEVEAVTLSDKVLSTVRDILPLAAVIFLVLGLMFLGVATPTEAAALGALGTFALAGWFRCLDLQVVLKSMTGTLMVTVMIFTIIAGSAAFSQIISFSGVSRSLVEFVLSLAVSPMWILAVMLGIVIALGCFMEQVSIMMITIPIFMPIVNQLSFDPVWFGVLMLISLEIGQLSPPVGLVLFVMKGVAPPDISMKDIYKSAVPYCFADLAGLLLIILFPSIALWLPGLSP
ncbi:MAG: TRAP transporter large permease [Bacillota bacterium]